MKKGYINWAFIEKYQKQTRDYSKEKIEPEYYNPEFEEKVKKEVINSTELSQRLNLNKNLKHKLKHSQD